MFYQIAVRFAPRLLNFEEGKVKTNHSYYDKKNYFQYYNLAGKSYDYLAGHCKENLNSNKARKVGSIFSPFGLVIGDSICEAVKKLGNPDCFLSNRGLMKRYYTLFYKRQIGDLKCILEFHFHKRKLFLSQVSIHDDDLAKREETDLVALLFGEEFKAYNKLQAKNGKIYFEDINGYSICTVKEPFCTHFILSDQKNSSLKELLKTKFKGDRSRRNYNETYKKIFLAAS